jgi:acyl dehydratase
MIETEEKLFSERDLLLGILWEGDAQLHTNNPGMQATPFGSTIVHGNSVTSMVLGRLFNGHFGSAEKVSVKELTVSYLAPVHVGDLIKALFEVEEQQNILNTAARFTMSFEVIKNEQTRVSKGKMTIEITGPAK